MNTEQTKEITEDILLLQMQASESLFHVASDLFFKKYESFKTYEEPIKKLYANHFKQNNSWYEGCSVFSSSTNNALENFNIFLKDKYVDYKRNSIPKFIK